MKKYVLGIDLGTYNSEAAVAIIGESGGESVLRVRDGGAGDLEETGLGERQKSFPSFVWYAKDGAVRGIGVSAKEAVAKDPRLVIWGMKRLLGKTYTEAAEQGEFERFEYEIEPNVKTGGQCSIVVGERVLSPEDVCRELLAHIKQCSEHQTGIHFAGAVISIPAYFDALHASPIVHAAREAGFSSVQTIPEPVAAAIAYGVHVTPRPLKVLVFDLGAGTLDVTAGTLSRKGPNQSDLTFSCRITTGNTHLGGVDMDDRATRFVYEACAIREEDLTSQDRQTIRREAEKAKIRLSKVTKTDVELEISCGRYTCTMDRLDLNRALHGGRGELDIIGECRRQVVAALAGSAMTPETVDELLLIGGPSTMPCVLGMLKEVFATNPNVLQSIARVEEGRADVNPMEAVARGAALSSQTRKIIPHPYGYGFIQYVVSREAIDEIPQVLIPRGSTYPVLSEPQDIQWDTRSAEIEIELIQQVPVTESHGSYEFKQLGIVRKARNINGMNRLQIAMGLNENEELFTIIKDRITGEQVQFTGISHFKRIPILLPRKINIDVDQTQRKFVWEEIDKNVLTEFIGWANGVKRRIGAAAEDADPRDVRGSAVERQLKRFEETFLFHIDSGGKTDWARAEQNWRMVDDVCNELLHAAIEQNLVDRDTHTRLQTAGDEIKRRLIIRKEI